MTTPRYGLILITSLLPVSCDSAPEIRGTMTTDSAGIQIVTSDPSNSAAACTLSEEPMLTIGEEGDDENLWFSQVGGTGLLSDGSIAVIDGASSELRLFAEDGRHLWSAGGSGEGPGEFTRAWYLWVLPGDTMWVGNLRPWRYNVFTEKGEFVRAVERVTPYGDPTGGGGVLDNGVSINGTWGFSFVQNFTTPDTLILEAHSPDGQLISTVARVPNRVQGTTSKSEALGINLVLNPLFSAQAMADAGRNTIAIGQSRDPEVRLLDEEFRLRRIVRWSEPGREVTSADVNAYRDSYVESRGGRDSERWGAGDEVQIDPDRPVAEVFPAFSSIAVARDGRLWVFPYRKPGQNPREWMAFETDGTFFCHLARTHPNFTPHEFGADYALGVEADELGVQTVAMYRLSRGSGP